jgi:hypothetical protein
MTPLSTSPPQASRQRTLRVHNTSDETLNAWSVAQFASGNPLKIRDGEPTWDIEIVDEIAVSIGDPWRFVFLLDRPILPRKEGLATQDWPVLARAGGASLGGRSIEILVDGERVLASRSQSVSPSPGSQILDGFQNIFTQLGPIGRAEDGIYGRNILRYVTPARQNFPSSTTIGGTMSITLGTGSAFTNAEAGSGFTVPALTGYRDTTGWFEAGTGSSDFTDDSFNEEDPLKIKFPGWYQFNFTARVQAPVDVAGIVGMGMRFTQDSGDEDEYTEADHQPVVFPFVTGSGGDPSHTHAINYGGGYDSGSPRTVNPNIWLGMTLLHRFTSPGSMHFRNFGLIDYQINEFHWNATYRGPHYSA